MNQLDYEQALWDRGFSLVCGVDEAGRGPLAGPVVAAAVILDPDRPVEGLDDSKKLTEKKREALFPLIQERALAFGVGMASEQEIDQYNILQATFLAMRRAVEQLSLRPDAALVDGNQNPDLGIPTQTVIKGDALSASIGAASILAKVTRDHLMLQLDQIYPQYHFAKHKGYPTKDHYACLAQHGPSPVHRRSFLKRWFQEHTHE